MAIVSPGLVPITHTKNGPTAHSINEPVRTITTAKGGTLHNRRIVGADIKDKAVLKKLFEEIAPLFANRPGGYTRILKTGTRRGDNAPLALIELVTYEVPAV